MSQRALVNHYFGSENCACLHWAQTVTVRSQDLRYKLKVHATISVGLAIHHTTPSVFWLQKPVPRAGFSSKPSTPWLKPIINTISLGQVPPNLRHSLSTVPSQSGTPFQPASQKLRHWPALNPSWRNLRDLAPRPLPPYAQHPRQRHTLSRGSADYYSRSRSRSRPTAPSWAINGTSGVSHVTEWPLREMVPYSI